MRAERFFRLSSLIGLFLFSAFALSPLIPQKASVAIANPSADEAALQAHLTNEVEEAVEVNEINLGQFRPYYRDSRSDRDTLIQESGDLSHAAY